MIKTDYNRLCGALLPLIEGTRPVTAFSNTASLIFHEMHDVSWVGFYFYDHSRDCLFLGPFQGKPACVEIPKGKGVCGSSFLSGMTLIVPDVNSFPGHIACDADSRSEIVVPIKICGNTEAVLDIDSTSPDRFDSEDREYLERIAGIIGKYSEHYFPFDF